MLDIGYTTHRLYVCWKRGIETVNTRDLTNRMYVYTLRFYVFTVKPHHCLANSLRFSRKFLLTGRR